MLTSTVSLRTSSARGSRLMAGCVLCWRVPRLHYLPALRKGLSQAQDVQGKAGEEAVEQEGKRGDLQHQDASPQGGYRLHYNPSVYHHSVCSSALSQSQTDNDDDEQCLPTLAPSLWQQSNRYNVSSSQRLSSSKNMLLDLAFNKEAEPKQQTPLHHKIEILPDIKVDRRAFLKCRPEYACMALDLTQQREPIEWEQVLLLFQRVTILQGNMKPSDITKILTELSRLDRHKMSLLQSDKRVSMLLRYSVENLGLFTLPQLLEVLQSFVWLGIPSNHTVLGLYVAELCRRSREMTFHQLLFVADVWRCLGKQVPQFLQHVYGSVRMYLRQMEASDLVQLLNIMGDSRKCPADLIPVVEQLLMRHLQQLHPEEVGIVCLALFKTQTSISETTVNRIVDKACSFVEDMSDFAIVNVLKYLRFSYLFHRAWMEAMTREVPRRASGMGVTGLMHVALTCSALHYRNDDILTAVAENVPPLVPHCRSKDSCKLLWAFGTLGFLPDQSPSLYPSLTESLRLRKAEFLRYPEHLLTGLLGLAFVSQFPEDLIELALSPDFVNMALKSTKLELKKDLFTLDRAVYLELPGWTGPRLSPELRQEVVDTLWKFAQSDVCQKLEVQEAASALQNLFGGEEFVCKRMIMPHTRSIDLEVHMNSAGDPVPVNLESNTTKLSPKNSSSTSPSNHGLGMIQFGATITEDLIAQLVNNKKSPLSPAKPISLHRVEPDEGGAMFNTGLRLTSALTEALTKPIRQKPAPQDSNGIVKLAIQVCNRNHYCWHSQQLLGLHAMKRRHLKLAGYRVVELSHQEWFPLLRKSRAEKLAYLHCKIYNSLEI